MKFKYFFILYYYYSLNFISDNKKIVFCTSFWNIPLLFFNIVWASEQVPSLFETRFQTF